MQITHKSQYPTNPYCTIKLVMKMTRLKDLREDNDLTQKQLAGLLNCSQANYSRYESGKVDVPLESLKKLAVFYNTSIDYILNFTNEKKPYKRIKKQESY